MSSLHFHPIYPSITLQQYHVWTTQVDVSCPTSHHFKHTLGAFLSAVKTISFGGYVLKVHLKLLLDLVDHRQGFELLIITKTF